MPFREFTVPSDDDVVDAFGVTPEAAEDEPTIRRFQIDTDTGDRVIFSYDSFGRSVRCRWLRGTTTVLDVYRESATLMRVGSGNGSGSITVDFESDELTGKLTIEVYPSVKISDELLLR